VAGEGRENVEQKRVYDFLCLTNGFKILVEGWHCETLPLNFEWVESIQSSTGIK